MTIRNKLLRITSGGAVTPPTPTYASTVLADSPIHYWRFSETTGTSVDDIGSTPQDGTVSGEFSRGAISLVPSSTDAAIDLVAGGVSVGTAARVSAQQTFSFECWFRVDSVAGNSANPVLFFSGRYNNSGWYCQVVNTVQSRPYIQFTTSHPTSIFTTSAIGSVNVGTVYHLVCTRNGATVKIYLNGVEVSYQAQGSHGSNITATTDPSYIGAYWNSGPLVNSLNGAIDDVAFYDYVLTPTQVANHYAEGIGSTEFDHHIWANVANLAFDDTPNGLLYDDAGIVTWENWTAVTAATPAKFGSTAGYFSGIAHILATRSTEFNFGSNDFTMEAWVRPTSLKGSNDGNGILANRNSAANGWALGIEGYTGKLRFRAHVGSWDDNFLVSTNTLQTNTYAHVAVTRQQNVWRLFLNGNLEASRTASQDLNHQGTVDMIIGAAARDTREWAFQGNIDSVRITKNVCRYTANFTPEDSAFSIFLPDAPIPQTDLLLHCDGANASTTFIDASPKQRTVSALGGAQITTAEKKFGTGSYSGALNRYLTVPTSSAWDIGNSNFTMEAWIRPTADPALNYQPILGHDNIGLTRGWLLICDKTYAGKVLFAVRKVGGDNVATDILLLSNAAPPINQWTHVAVTREGDTWRLFINGVLEQTVLGQAGLTCQNPKQPLQIGTLWVNNFRGADQFIGQLDEIRFIKGHCRYVSTFTPETTAFTE